MQQEESAMFTRSVLLMLIAGPALAAGPGLGTPITHAELAAWDLHILPDGNLLPHAEMALAL